MQKYSANQQLIETVLASVKAGEIAISEIQRPFVFKIGNRPTKEYFRLITNQIQNANPVISGISTETELLGNLRMNCVPEEIMEMEMRDYQEFLG
jgi:hypothetical protein